MEQLGPIGAVFVAASLLLNTVLGAVFAYKNKRGDAAWRWRRRMEPVHLDLLDWASSVQMWAAARGMRQDVPPLPDSLKGYHLDEEPEEWDLPRRHHDRAP